MEFFQFSASFKTGCELCLGMENNSSNIKKIKSWIYGIWELKLLCFHFYHSFSQSHILYLFGTVNES